MKHFYYKDENGKVCMGRRSSLAEDKLNRVVLTLMAAVVVASLILAMHNRIHGGL